MPPAIEADGLVKRFGATTALAGASLSAAEGTVLGVLGPNGAGKTTATRVLATLLAPDEGRAVVGGYDVITEPHRVRSLIGLTGQYAGVDEALTGTENLVLIARLLGQGRAAAKARAADLLGQFGLSDAAGRAARTYSGGMRRRLDLAASLVGRPRILFLDEPTTGLDPASRNELWGMVRRLTDDGVTVLLTTQYLEEADQLADDIVVIDRGAVVATGTPDDLKARAGAAVLQMRPTDAGQVAVVTRIAGELAGSTPTVDQDTVSVPAGDDALDARRRPPPRRRRRAPRRADAAARHPRRGLPRAHRPPRGRRLRQHDRPGAGVTLDRTVAGPPAADLPAAPPPPSRRTTPAQWASQSLTMAWRSLVQIKHNPSELLDLSIQPIMFVLLFTFVFGGAIGGSTDAYLQFSLGGLIAQNALFLTVYTATGLATDLQKGTFDRFRSLPIARSAPLSGRIMGDVVRQLWSLVVLLAVGVALGFRITTSPLAVLAAFGLLVAFTVAFSWTSVLLGVLARDPEKVQIYGFTVLFPLTFASNAFAPTETMPDWLQAWVSINPVTRLADALRGLLVGGPVAANAVATLLWGVAFAAVFGPLAVWALRTRV